MDFQGMVSRRFCSLVSLSVVVPLGNLADGARSQGTSRVSRSVP